MNTQLKSHVAFVGLAVAALCAAIGLLAVQAPESVQAKPPRSPLAPPTPEPIAPVPGLPASGAPAEPTLLPYGPKGIGGRDRWGSLDHDVWYHWDVGQDVTDSRFARMVWCPTDDRLYGSLEVYTKTIQAAQNDYANEIQGRVWLVFNEPDHPVDQCGFEHFADGRPPVHEDPMEAAVRYALVYDTIKQHDPYARVFAGGLLFLNSVAPAGNNTRWWWDTFLDTLEANGDLNKLEGVHVHAYDNLTISTERPEDPGSLPSCPHPNCLPELAEALDDWYTDVHQADPRTTGLPIWITETGWLMCAWEPYSPEGYEWVRDEYMAPVAEWFYGNPEWSARYPGVLSNPGYGSIIWFHSRTDWESGLWCTWLVKNDDTLTPGGEYWNALPLPVFDARLPLAMRNYDGQP